MKRVLILGATKGMGRALARLLAERGERLCLLGRDMKDLERSARDLEVRGASKPVDVAFCDLEKPESFEPALREAQTKMGGIDLVIVTAGLFARQEELEEDSERAQRLLTVDFTNTMLFCEAARKPLLMGGGGTLCERGRKPVILYGAAKAGLSRYLEGLDHKYRSEGLKVVCVKPGFVKTGMTQGLKPPPFAGEAESVARRVLKAIDRGEPVVYAPAAWKYIMMAIRGMPRVVMRRLNF